VRLAARGVVRANPGFQLSRLGSPHVGITFTHD